MYRCAIGSSIVSGGISPRRQRLNAELVRALRSPGGKAWFEAQGGEVVADSAEAFAEAVRSEHARWREVIQQARIKAE